MPGRTMELTPSLFLTMWAAGLAAAAAVVAVWRVVGPGYLWLAGGSTLAFGALGWRAGGGRWAMAGTAAVVLGVVLARAPRPAAAALGLAAVFFLAAAVAAGGLASGVTGSVALGGVTSEMMLGHWYLVDPRLPRWPLRRLDVAGALGVTADTAVLLALGAGGAGRGDAVITWAFLGLAATTLALMAAVWFSLGERAYSGVMAATGLSYLAMLTVIGAVVAGRSLIAEGGSTLAVTLLGR